jgi:hypothetical protein
VYERRNSARYNEKPELPAQQKIQMMACDQSIATITW